MEWVRLKETFFTYFLPHKEEALGNKERCPINYMAYIEEHFYRATGLHLNGLRGFTTWIKQGSYYHGLVAQQGRLHECPHLVGLLLHRRPQVMPSESHRESQMKAEATATSSSKPSAGPMVAPVAETPVVEAPVTETPGAETPAAPSDTPAPMETGGVGDGQRSITSPNPRSVSQDQCFPSPSKTVRGGLPPFHSSMSMPESSLPPTTMWQVEGSCISIWRCCHARPHA